MARGKRGVEVPLTRKQLSRRQKEERQRRFVLLGAGLFFLLVVSILGFGYYEVRFSPVARVNGVPIRTDRYQDRVRYERFLLDRYLLALRSQLQELDPNDESQAYLIDLLQGEVERVQEERSLLGSQALEMMIEEELIRQEAERRGVTVTPEEVDRAIEESFGYQGELAASTPTPSGLTPTPIITVTENITPTPTIEAMTRVEFEERYQSLLDTLKEAGFSEETYRAAVARDLLRSKMGEIIGQEVPTREDQVHLRHIVFGTKEEAEAAQARLEAGEDFAALAKELSTDSATKDRGGDMGWISFDPQKPLFSSQAFELEPGEMSPVVPTENGYEIILVEEKEKDREIDPVTLAQRREEAFSTWLASIKSEARIERPWSEDKVPPE